MFKRYEHLRERTLEGLSAYTYEVQQRLFPAEANTFTKISEQEAADLAQWLEQGMPA